MKMSDLQYLIKTIFETEILTVSGSRDYLQQVLDTKKLAVWISTFP
jgi:hypothetical protein